MPGQTSSVTFSFTVSGTFTPSPSQPKPIAVNEAAYAEWGSPPPYAASVNDGFGDPTVGPSAPSSYNTFTSSGTHVTTVTSNTFTHNVTMTVSIGPGSTGGAFTYMISPDPRSVGIGGGTSAKVPIANDFDMYGNQQYQPGSEPAGLADIGLPSYTDGYLDSSDFETISFVGLTQGPWSPNGSYSWSDSLKGDSASGTVSPESPGVGPFYVTYVGGDTDTPPTGDIGKTDNIKLTYTDASSGVTGTGALQVTLHPASNAYAIAGPTSTSDPNYYGYIPQQLRWPDGQPGNETQSYPVSSTAPYAGHAGLVVVANGLNTVGAALTAYAPLDLDVEPWGAIATLMGVFADDIASGLPQNGTISLNTLWPGSASGPYPSQWVAASYTGTPVEYPTTSAAPPDWTPGSTGPNSISEPFTCTPWAINIYEMSLKAVDNWGASGYTGYQQGLYGTFHVQTTIGVWTYTRGKN